ncbi:hypothetical protein ACFC3F_01850 [Microbacterium sp. NPDC055910]|uniref:hypothetical protein n=1 Tax=Microbacterium sp. NPDC055910 TaxID=3345659 RepID=UPI0035DD10D7
MALGLVAVAGCSGVPGGPDDQSVADACSQASASVSAAQSDLSDITTDVTEGNFSVVAEQLGALHTNLAETAESLGNADVRRTLNALANKVGDFARIFDGAPDGDLTAIADRVTELQSVSRDVAAAGQAMSDLCN